MNYDRLRDAVTAVAAKNGINRSDVTGYQVAKHLGVSDGGAFYKQWEAFLEKEFGAHIVPPADIPPELLEILKDVINRSMAGVMAASIEVIRSGRVENDAATSLRVRDAERRADHAKAEARHILASLEAREAERDTAMAELETARRSIEQKDRRITHLEGRIEQCDVERQIAQHMQMERAQPEKQKAESPEAGETAVRQTSPDLNSVKAGEIEKPVTEMPSHDGNGELFSLNGQS